MAERARQKPIWYVVGCIGLVFASVPCLGVAAAIAVPGFVSYARRSKTTEARTNVAAIARGVVDFCASREGSADRLPAAIGPTLATPSDARQLATPDPAWDAVGFQPMDPLYYAYSIERADPTHLRVVAEGDLDADGTRSRFVVACEAPTTGDCACGEVEVTHELE